ncbi:MAG: hypothetical protein RR842_13185 [Gordonibacter sp.]|uniref:hypothetical protein n=1 Tax=Gordonibacter sp. TaxID=1968902 RepID=UPI002FCB2565
MEDTCSKFEAARKASDINIEKACTICKFTPPTLSERERNPSSWRLGELVSLHASMSDIAKKILIEAVNDIFLS